MMSPTQGNFPCRKTMAKAKAMAKEMKMVEKGGGVENIQR
jgi:hypothetical protein